MMKRTSLTALLLAAVALTGCNQAQDEVRRVQTNVVSKSIFEGEWWFMETVVDVDGDEASIGFTYSGAAGWGDIGVDTYQSLTNARIRWVIDEGYLYAFRAYELIEGGNDDGDEPDFRGQPIAAFAIQTHFDIRRDYSSVTGEETNVISENSSDRRWYEREFMRVDWSKNVITSFQGDLFGFTGYAVEPASFFFQENSHQNGEVTFPASYYPQFVTVGEDPGYRFADEWPADQQDTVHYMSFVTQVLASPRVGCFQYNLPCQTVAMTIRNAFLRVPPNHAYASQRQSHVEFDRFGTFRTYQRTYVRGGQDNSDLNRFCRTNEDCATDGGYCNTESGICEGGLSDDLGETDFLTFYRPNYNMWQNPLSDTACLTDWQCSEQGATCDRAAQRCTIPTADRTVRQVTYHLNAGYPEHLAKVAYEIVGGWNEVFMQGVRASRGEALPDYNAVRMACQEDNPTTYCFCGSPEVAADNTCVGKFDPFVSPADYTAMGVTNPYDCQITNTAGWAEPARPTTFEEYEGAYNHEFTGSECVLVLKSNSCDLDETAACEDLGDIRYQFFNYVNHGSVMFGGVAAPRVDPTTGELVTSNANMGGESVESVATRAIEYFPVLRCANPTLGCAAGEEGAAERYLTGENLRDYFSNAGRTERPVGLAPAGRDASSATDTSRPAFPIGRLARSIEEHIGSHLPEIEQLQGREGRLNVMSDRMGLLAGTDTERTMVGSLGPDGIELMDNMMDRSRVRPGASALDRDMLEQLSPYRNSLAQQSQEANAFMENLQAHGWDPPLEDTFRNSNWEYFAEAFRDRPIAEASLRARQMVMRMVMYHELGHCVGLRHNFGGSFDRNNYYDAYYELAADLPIPNVDDYDDPALGGNADGFSGAQEVNRYLADLREVREERARRGGGNTMSSSIMDYHGDLSDTIYGLGRYDVAATVWNHFNMVEQFVAEDPYTRADDSTDGLARSNELDRVWWQYYEGGESCAVDADCPYSDTASLPAGQVVHQRCIRNPRFARLPEPCGTDERSCVCSPIAEDLKDYVDDVAYVAPGESNQFSPVDYLFCTDDRTSDISWCNRYDAGESFQESIDNFRRGWTQSYPLAYNRRFRLNGARGGSSTGNIYTAVKIYQHLFFRLYYEPGFSSNEGPLGFIDQFMASVDAMNWLTEIVNLPDTGSYELDTEANLYRQISSTPGAPGADIDLTTGAGYPTWSRYQEGLNGFFRVEQRGTFFDKYYALYALANRDWSLGYSVDERFYINFYNLFDIEMTEFFGGVIQNEPSWFAPRLRVEDGEPVVQNMNLYRGVTLGECRSGGVRVPCRGAQPDVYTDPAIDGTVSDFLRLWGAQLALAFFPVYYDTTYQQRLVIFKAGSGEGFDIPNFQADGTVTCAYGANRLSGTTHDTGCSGEEADYVVYESDRLHTPYVAQKVRSRISFNLEEEQTGFQMLRNMVDNQARVNVLLAQATRTAAEELELTRRQDKLRSDESFLEVLIDLQRIFGIS